MDAVPSRGRAPGAVPTRLASRTLRGALLAALTACGGVAGAAAPQPAPGPAPAEAPWSAPPLAPGDVPDVYLAEWRSAQNRASCAPLAPRALGAGEGATPRAATFSGGWGVAYDLPNLRSAFGVAGTGATPSADTYDQWPHRREWADGSSVGYGPEGGTGPNQLAYLRVQGQRCLYNVWSRLGREHLELLLSQLRFVRPAG